MARPAGIKYKDRVSTKAVAGSWWFRCQCARAVSRRFATRSDAVVFRSEHDALHHDGGLLRKLGVKKLRVVPTISEVVDRYLDYVRSLEADGVRDHKTVLFYEGIGHHLKEALGDVACDEFEPYDYVRSRKGKGRARTVKHLKALQTMLRHARQPVNWLVPVDDIRPKKKQRMKRTADELARFVAAMAPQSDERDWVVAKLRLGLRNEEMRDLRVSAYDAKERLLSFELKAKRKRLAHVVALPDEEEIVEIFERRTRGKRPSDLVFTVDGRRVLESSFRKRFLRASERAKLKTPITGEFRHHFITAGLEGTGSPYEMMKAIGHRYVTTTLGYRLERPEVEQLRKAANAAASQLPLKRVLLRSPDSDDVGAAIDV
jgi:site-specific recombinase XerC